MIAFNLASYANVTDRMEDAKERLRNAIELDKDIRRLAIDDEDLKPLWDWIGGLEYSSNTIPSLGLKSRENPAAIAKGESREKNPLLKLKSRIVTRKI
jgi:hypothetical protein